MLSTTSDSTRFRGPQFPPEQPLEFQSTQMSKAQIYQPARWEFLRFLERDLNGKWYLCSECFTLHPLQMFAEYQKLIVPWLKDYYQLKGFDFRSCRHERKILCSQRKIAFAPSGIVDLCPCIKMTIGKKRQIEARLREDVRKTYENDRPERTSGGISADTPMVTLNSNCRLDFSSMMGQSHPDLARDA